MTKLKITPQDVSNFEYESHIIDSNDDTVRILYRAGSRREYASYDMLPDYFIKALVAGEDRRYYKHKGIDPKGIIRSIVKAVLTRGKEMAGASTITQQLIKNTVFPDWHNEKTLGSKLKRKIKEQNLALKLEHQMTKEQILECYVNAIFFGSGCYGARTAARLYFDKDINELSLPECAMLAGVPKRPVKNNPLIYPEKATWRMHSVANKLYSVGYINEEEYKLIKSTDYTERMTKRNEEVSNKAKVFSYYEDALIEEVISDLMHKKSRTRREAYDMLYAGGINIYTAQNTKIQKFCDQLFEVGAEVPDKNLQSGAMLMDPVTREVVAMVGGTGPKEGSLIFNRATEARRSCGSYPISRFFKRTGIEMERGICIQDVCDAYCAYYDESNIDEHRLYRKVTDKDGNVILENEPLKKSARDESKYPLPSMLELPTDKDLWVVGQAGGLVLGVWCGYDDNSIIPLREEYYTCARKLWEQIESFVRT